MTAPKIYSTKRRSISVPIEGEDGIIRNYRIVELNGTGRDAYFSVIGKKIRVDGKEGTAAVREFAGMCSDLLCACMLDPAGVPVTALEVNEWPSAMQMELFVEAQKLSGLDKKSETEAKND